MNIGLHKLITNLHRTPVKSAGVFYKKHNIASYSRKYVVPDSYIQRTCRKDRLQVGSTVVEFEEVKRANLIVDFEEQVQTSNKLYHQYFVVRFK